MTYQCKIFDVWEEEFDLPNGKTIRQSWINHNPTVAIVAINDKNELILIKQYRNAVKKNLLEIPAGSLDGLEESPAVCAQRELAEETGFQAKTLIKLFEGYFCRDTAMNICIFFWPRDLFSAPLTPDEDEFIETMPISFSQSAQTYRKRRDN